MSKAAANSLSEAIARGRENEKLAEQQRLELKRVEKEQILLREQQEAEDRNRQLMIGPRTGEFIIGARLYYVGSLMDNKRHGCGKIIKRGHDGRVDFETICNYNMGSREGLFTTTYRNGAIKTTWYDNNTKTDICEITYPNGDTFFRSFTNGTFTAEDRGTFVSSKGTKYLGHKAYATRNMWRCIGAMWTGTGNCLEATDRGTECQQCCSAPCNCVAILVAVGFSSVASIGAAIATPFTMCYDSIKRACTRFT